MLLPIDARKAPFKPKYLDEETRIMARWFEFGTHAEGTVDISDSFGDVIIATSTEKAWRIIKARNEFCNVLVRELS